MLYRPAPTGVLTGVGTTPEPQGRLPSPALIAHEAPAHQAWHTQDRMAANQPVKGADGSLRADADAGDDDAGDGLGRDCECGGGGGDDDVAGAAADDVVVDAGDSGADADGVVVDAIAVDSHPCYDAGSQGSTCTGHPRTAWWSCMFVPSTQVSLVQGLQRGRVPVRQSAWMLQPAHVLGPA